MTQDDFVDLAQLIALWVLSIQYFWYGFLKPQRQLRLMEDGVTDEHEMKERLSPIERKLRVGIMLAFVASIVLATYGIAM